MKLKFLSKSSWKIKQGFCSLIGIKGMGEGRCRCCCVSYQTRVVLFAVTNIFVTGISLILPLISTGFIVYFGATSQKPEAKYILHEETLQIFKRIIKLPQDSSKLNIADFEVGPSPLQSDVHVWASWLFMKVIMLAFSVLLYIGARKRKYGLVVGWFAMNVAVGLHGILLLALDAVTGLLWRKELKAQVAQISLSVYTILGLLFVLFFLRTLALNKNPHIHHFQRDQNKFRDPATLHFMYNGLARC